MSFRDGGVPPGAARWDPTPAPRSAAASGRAPQTNRLRAVVPAVKRLLQQPPTKATCAIRLPENESLRREVAELLVRPVGRPNRKPLVRYKSFLYRAASWSKARMVVAKVEHHAGELFPRDNFIVTNLTLPSRSVVRFYNKRGAAEQWIKEGQQATHWTRLSCHPFRANEVRLQLSVLAYNLGNPWRRLVLPPANQELVADELTAAVSEDGRSIDQAREVLLVAASRRASESAVVRQYAAEDLGLTAAEWVGRSVTGAKLRF